MEVLGAGTTATPGVDVFLMVISASWWSNGRLMKDDDDDEGVSWDVLGSS